MRRFLSLLLAAVCAFAPAAQSLAQAPGGPIAAVRSSTPVPAGLRDDFSVATASLGGAVVAPEGGATWTIDPTTGAITNTPFIASGVLKNLTFATNQSKTLAYVQPATTSAEQWTTWHFDPVTDGTVTSSTSRHLWFYQQFSTVTAGSSYAKHAYDWLYSTSGGQLVERQSASGLLDANLSSMTMTGTGNAFGLDGGDVLSFRKRTTGGHIYYDAILNGHKVTTGATAVDGVLPVINDSTGVRADINNGGEQWRHFEVGDPNTQAMITMVHPGKTAQVKFWDGSNDTFVRLGGNYSQGPPRTLIATVYNADTGAAVAGYTGIPVASYTASNGNWSGNLTIKTASTPSRFYVEVERRDTFRKNASARALAWTPVLRPGWVVAGWGQSLMTQFWQNSTTATYTPPTNSFSADGSTDAFAAIVEDFRISHSATTTQNPNSVRSHMLMLATLSSVAGHSNFTFIRGGFGGKDEIDRDIGSTIWDSFIVGIRDMATDVGVVISNGGTFEIDNQGLSHYSNTWTPTQAATQKARIVAQVKYIEAIVGHPIIWLLPGPPAKESNAQSVQANAYYRMLTEMVRHNGVTSADFPDGVQRFYLGSACLDLQGNTTDSYHKAGTADGFGEMGRRYGYDLAKLMGYTSVSRIGPSIASVAKQSSNTIRVYFDLNGANDIDLINAAQAGTYLGGSFAAGDFRGGLGFYDSTCCTTELVPTGWSKGTAAGGQNYIDFTFASLPTTTVVRGPYGQNPFNRTGNGTATTGIRGNMMTGASKVVGTYGDTGTFYDPPVQMWFNPANDNGDVSADFLLAS
jgi:hypothetical protein